MEAADDDREAGGTKWPGDVHGTRKLVRLHANKPDHAEAAVARQLRDDSLQIDARVGLVDRRDVDGDVGPEHLPLRGINREAVNGRERVRWHSRAQPLNDVTVVVVMRRLDQDELKPTLGPDGWRQHSCPFPLTRPACPQTKTEVGRCRHWLSRALSQG